jgi:hypothetical protein
MPTRTYGSTIVTNKRGQGGRYFNGNVLDKDIASFRELELWVDGKALVGLAPVRGVDRIGGAPFTAPSVAASPAIVPSAADFDGPGFSFTKTAAQSLRAPDYTLPANSYHFLAVVTPTNANTSVRGLMGHVDGTGNRVRWWLSQAATGDPLGMSMNHGSSGGNSLVVAPGSTGITHSVKHLLWGSYDHVNQVVAMGRGLNVIGNGSVTVAPKVSTDVGLFWSGASTQEFFGQGDAILIGNGPLWDAYAPSATNAKRIALINLLASRYNVVV